MLIKILNLLANPFSIQNIHLMGKLFSPLHSKEKKGTNGDFSNKYQNRLIMKKRVV